MRTALAISAIPVKLSEENSARNGVEMMRLRHVALIIPQFPSITPRLLAGVRSYFSKPDETAFHLFSAGSATNSLFWLKERFDGALVYTCSDKRVDTALKKWRVPHVYVLEGGMDKAASGVVQDDVAVGQMAADYLMNRGFVNLAMVRSHRTYSADREAGFLERTSTHELHVATYLVAKNEQRPSVILKQLGKWIQALPKPVAVFAVNDSLGTQILEVCREQSIEVPTEVTVLGVGDAIELCCLSWPSLSSIAIPYERISYEAASILDDLMRKGTKAKQWLQIPPLGVTTRDSSLSRASDDPIVVAAMRYIMAHACRPIGVSDVAQHVGYSYRRLLERFQESLGIGIHQVIRQVQISRAKRLLTETNLPVYKVAHDVGWKDGKEINRIFQREVGMTPAAFRQRDLPQ